MKNAWKAIFKIFIAFVLLIGVIGCDGCKPEPKPEPEESKTKLIELSGIVPVKEARSLYDAYKKYRVKLIEDFENSGLREKLDNQNESQQQNQRNNSNSDDGQFKASRFISFEYDSIKKYLRYIEQEAELSGEKITGLRFYLANNPDEEKFDNGSQVRYPRQNSIMISPTIEKNGKESIFFTVGPAEGERKAVLLENDFVERGKKSESDDEGDKSYENNNKTEASFYPNFMNSTPVPPMMFQEVRSTTFNRGHGSPPTN